MAIRDAAAFNWLRVRKELAMPITVDGNEAAASVAYRTNEVIAIHPITPASPMGELARMTPGALARIREEECWPL